MSIIFMGLQILLLGSMAALFWALGAIQTAIKHIYHIVSFILMVITFLLFVFDSLVVFSYPRDQRRMQAVFPQSFDEWVISMIELVGSIGAIILVQKLRHLKKFNSDHVL